MLPAGELKVSRTRWKSIFTPNPGVTSEKENEMTKKTNKTTTKKTTRKRAQQAAPALTQAEVAVAMQVETKAYDFQGAVTLMDETSQRAFRGIVSLAKLARVGLSTLDGQFGPVGHDDIQNALAAIINIATDAKEDINVLAEGVDCDYSDAPFKAAA